jgi:hypothetical protein
MLTWKKRCEIMFVSAPFSSRQVSDRSGPISCQRRQLENMDKQYSFPKWSTDCGWLKANCPNTGQDIFCTCGDRHAMKGETAVTIGTND